MAYIQVTSNTNGISFDLGVYSTALGFSKAFRNKNSVTSVVMNDNFISYRTSDGGEFSIVATPVSGQPNLLVIESINGASPTDLEDLYNKLLAILN
jgi:hypothetical protein